MSKRRLYDLFRKKYFKERIEANPVLSKQIAELDKRVMATGGTDSQVEEGKSKCSAAQEEIKAMERRLTAIPPERSACEVVAVSAELTKPGELVEQQLHARKNILDELVAKEDFVGAARAQSYITQLEEEAHLTAQTALDHGSCEAITTH